jgi:hypothetical protein
MGLIHILAIPLMDMKPDLLGRRRKGRLSYLIGAWP